MGSVATIAIDPLLIWLSSRQMLSTRCCAPYSGACGYTAVTKRILGVPHNILLTRFDFTVYRLSSIFRGNHLSYSGGEVFFRRKSLPKRGAAGSESDEFILSSGKFPTPSFPR